MTRIIVLSDVHGNAVALAAVRAVLRLEKPDLVAVAGDLVLNGPDPSGTVDLLREMEADGAAIISGNTDIAVADFDYAAAFPWLTDGVPEVFQAATGEDALTVVASEHPDIDPSMRRPGATPLPDASPSDLPDGGSFS